MRIIETYSSIICERARGGEPMGEEGGVVGAGLNGLNGRPRWWGRVRCDAIRLGYYSSSFREVR